MAMLPKFIPQSVKYNLDSSGDIASTWSWFREPVGISKTKTLVKPGLLEQINTTADKSDYLWYSSRYCIQVVWSYTTYSIIISPHIILITVVEFLWMSLKY